MNKKPLLILIIVLILVGSLIALLLIKNPKLFESDEKPVQVQSRVNTETNGTGLHLSAADMKAAAIDTSPLKAISHSIDHPAYAEVLDMSSLVTDIAHYQSLSADIAKSDVALNVARQTADRSRHLHADDRNISDQALETAEATLRTETVNHTALITERDSALNNLRLNWGQELIAGINQQHSALASLITGKASLLRISKEPTNTSEQALNAMPATITLATSNGVQTARVIGSAPHADDRLQGSQTLIAISNTFLPIGLRLAAQWPEGIVQQGIHVPASAVVWWQGLPWVYIQVSPNNFRREQLNNPQSDKEGWFVADGLIAGTPVVVRGAQLLLSEEQRGPTQAGDNDND